jgi:hypothetical protein
MTRATRDKRQSWWFEMKRMTSGMNPRQLDNAEGAVTQRLRARVTGTPHVIESRRKGGLATLQSTHGSFTAKPSNAIQRAQHETAHRTDALQSKRSKA